MKVMERCGVCSEKNYCTLCCHCDKKVCADCKEGHLDILRREIARVNNQVRRTLPRLQDALGVIDKNSTQLQTNCLSIIEEVDGLYRRLSKSLKDRTDHIKSEIEAFMSKELKAMTGLRANLEHEISNFDSNSEFAEKHVTAGTGGTEGGSSFTSSSANTVAWDDNELMDTKDIFLRTMEFIRNFETETGDYHRRVRFFVPQDPNQLSNTLANLGELTILAGPSSSSGQGPPTAPSLGPGLMRSKSDHRVAAAFRQQEERYNSMAYGSDNNDDMGGGTGRPRYFGERHGSVSTRAVDRYDTSSRRNDYGDYEEPDSGRRKFRSRFMRHHDSGDSDNEPAGRSVRFQAGETAESTANKKERQKVLDTEDAARGPLSGITRLTDSPRVIKRLQEVGRKKKPTPPTTLNLPTPATNTHQSLSSPSGRMPPRPTAAARQVSEEDEIAKIKKQNKGQEASSDSSTRKTDSTPTPSTPTGSGDRPRFTSQQSSNNSAEQQSRKSPAVSRQTSATGSEATQKTTTESSSSSGATPTNETAEEARTRRRSLLASSKSGTSTPNDTESESRQKDRTAVTASYAAAVASRTSSPAEDTSDRSSRRVGRVSTERFNKSSSESSTSAESSTHSSPVRNTGAAFSTVELKNRFGGGVTGGRKSSTGSTNGDASASMATTATRSRFGNTSGGATSPSTGRFGTGSSSTSSTTAVAAISNGTAAGAAPHRFQSRFLGRAGTPTAEASRGSENSQSSSSDDSSDSSESDSAEKPANGKSTAGSKAAAASKTTTTATKDRELARTDIGPLLARSAQARDTTTYPSSSSANHTSSAGNSRSTTTTTSSDSPSSYTPRSRVNASSAASSTTTSRPYSSSSRFGTDSSTTGSALSRSRTGSALADDMENKYPLTSKYLNRSRANLSSDTGGSYGGDSSGYHGSSSSASSSSTPRYSQTRGYQSRFLNKSKSSAALDCAPDGSSEVANDDEEDVDDNDEDYNKSSAVSTASASSTSQPLLVVSGDERYPSGRSRYAALKDRRSRLARSKSSHDVGPAAPLSPTAPSSSSNELTGGDGVVGGKASDPHYYGQLGGEVGDTGISSLEPTSPSAESASGSSLSTWYVTNPSLSQYASLAFT